MIIRDTPEAFADAVRAVLDDRGLRERLESNARETVSARHAWPRVGQELRAVYRAMLPP